MNRIALVGCSGEPLGSYLMGLGVWRAVVRLLDDEARAHWEAGHLVLTTSLADVDQLADELATRFEPLPVVSPWNEGSGFAGSGNSPAAEEILERILASSERRLGSVRAAVAAGDRIVKRGYELGFGDNNPQGKKLWGKAHKTDVITLARNMLPDDALPWVDAAVVLGRDGDPSYSRLLGTGGNFGRQDLSATYLAHALAVVAQPDTTRLGAALTGDESIRYDRGTVGQFDPGRAGGIQSSPFEDRDKEGFVNPWSSLLSIEGAVLFAAAVVRRFGANTADAAVPFVVAASTAGSPDAAAGERGLGEIWTPQWDRPARLPEVEQLLSEGRAEWRGTAARTGLDFVRAISSLGVDRGLSSFTRHVVVNRLGQNPLAVPTDRVTVEARPEVRLLQDLDTWLASLRNKELPAMVEVGLRAVEAAEYAVATGGGSAALQEVLITLGRLHNAVSRSGKVREFVRPLVLRRPSEWLSVLDTGSRELRLAAALASGRDGGDSPGPTLRELLTPVQVHKKGFVDWSDRPAPVSAGVEVVTMLAMAHRRRAMAGTVPEPRTPDSGDNAVPAVRGVLSAFHYGLRAHLHDVAAMAGGAIDERLLGDLLRGLTLADWSGRSGSSTSTRSHSDAAWHPLSPALALLTPFYASEALPLRRRDDDARPEPVWFRPGSEWIPLLLAGRAADVIADARRRLAITGVDRVATPHWQHGGVRLAAALLVPMSTSARVQALGAIADLPDQRFQDNQHEREAA